MALQKQVLQIPMTGGVDRKTDSHQLQSGQMYTANNIVYVSEKQIKKRNGYTGVYPPGGLQGAPFTAIGNRDNVEPVILGQNTLNRYNVQTGLSTFIPALTQGRIATKQVAATTNAGSGTGIPSPPISPRAVTDGTSYVFVTWQEGVVSGTTSTPFGSNLLWYGVQDLVTGNWIVSPRTFASPVTTYNSKTITYVGNLQPIYYNGNFYVFYRADQAFFGAYVLPLTNLAYGFTDTGLRIPYVNNSTVSTYADYSALIDKSGVLNFVSADATNKAAGAIQYYTCNGATFTALPKTTLLTQPSGVTLNSLQTTYALAVNGPSATPIVATADAYAYTVSSSNAVTTPLNIGLSPFEKTQLMFYNGLCLYSEQRGGNSTTRNASIVLGQLNPATNTISALTTLNPPAQTEFARSYSGMFSGVNAGFIYQWMVATSPNGSTDYLTAFLFETNLTTRTATIIGRCFYLNALNATSQCQVLPVQNNQYVTYMPTSTDAQQKYGVLNRTLFDFTPFRQNALLQLPTGGLIGAGAFPYQYDGQRIFEQGYSVSPSIDGTLLTITVGAGNNGGLTGNFRYSWSICFVKRDAYGNEIRSAPSIAYQLTTSQVSSASQCYVVFPAIGYSNDANTTIEYYRNTVANPAEFYYVQSVSNGSGFTDDYSDTAISGNRNLYTYSNELPNDPCPPVHCMAISESRAYVIPSDARNTVWASKQFAPGRSVEFNASLVLSEGRNSGLFTAVGVLDSNVIVFKEDAILYFYGAGPDNTGANGSFSAFTKLSSDVGCVDPSSLAVIPSGLLFRSRRGIELLTRGLQVQYVGFPVEPYVQAIKTINASVVLPQYNHVRFMSPVATDPTLVYDYAFNRWSTFSNTSVTACNTISGQYWNITPDGSTVLMETPGVFSDNGSNIIMTLETPEIDLAGMQGWGRAYRMAVLGDFKSSHQMNVSFAYDHSAVYQDQVGYSTAIQSDIDAVLSGIGIGFQDIGWDLNNPKSGSNPFEPYTPPTSLGRAPTVVVPPCAEQFRLSRMPRQRMQVCRIMLQDTPILVSYSNDGTYQTTPLAFGESCAISGITMEYGQKAGVAKLGPQRTI